MFFIEFIILSYVILLLGFISFFIKNEYSSSVLSFSLNNYSQIILVSLIFALGFMDNINYISITDCFKKDCFSFFFQGILTFTTLYVIIVSKQYVSFRLSFQQEYEILIID